VEQVKVLDASWYLPFMERSATGEFEKQRIPGAAFFDIDKICDLSSPHPHMMPSKEFFAERVGMLKVKRDDHVVGMHTPMHVFEWIRKNIRILYLIVGMHTPMHVCEWIRKNMRILIPLNLSKTYAPPNP
jgi:hypothetical protein